MTGARLSASACGLLLLLTPVAAAATEGETIPTPESGSEEEKPAKVRPVEYRPGRGAVLSTKDGRAEFTLGAWAQPVLSFAVLPISPEAAPPLPPTASLERARIELDAELPHQISFAFGLGYDAGKIEVLDAYAAWNPRPEFEFAVGNLKPPWGQERLIGARDLPYPERGAPSQTGGGRSISVRVRSELLERRLRLAVALARGAGSKDYEDAHNLDVVGRVAVVPDRSLSAALDVALVHRPDGIQSVLQDEWAEAGLGTWAWQGQGLRIGGDLALVAGALRLLLEGAVLREGPFQDEVPVTAGLQAVLGLAPKAERASAWDGGQIERGVEGIVRVDVLLADLPDHDGLPWARWELRPGLQVRPLKQLALGASATFQGVVLDAGHAVGLGANFWLTGGL